MILNKHKIYSIFIVLFISLRPDTAVSATSQQLYQESVENLYLKDPELRRCLLERRPNKIDNVIHIITLRCHAYNIQSLDGISALNKLEKVVIIGSDIKDASPLSRISSLKTIYLKGGNENIQGIRSLSGLRNLSEIFFPHMLETYCYKADAVLESMKENIDGPTKSNLNLVHCRGKKTSKVTNALRKIEQGKSLTSEESKALRDYESNLRWSN